MEKRQFSEEFKKLVVNQVEMGKLSKEEARIRYGIKGKSAILTWQRQLTMKKTTLETKKPLKTLNREELEDRVKKLEKAL